MTPETAAVNLLDIEKALEWTRQAGSHLDRQEYAQASELILKVLERFPELPEANFTAAKAFFRQGQFRKAMWYCVSELVNEPNNLRAQNLLMEMHLSRLIRGYKFDFPGTHPPRTWPSISLVMIVRNESAVLARCLDSVKDMVSEMIIVDTGSTDDTVEIAQSYGAKVFHYPWDDDFAAARNESLKHATGEWCMMMDADNWLDPEERNKMLWAVTSDKADVFLCKQMDWNSDTTWRGSPQARLFRNRKELRYRSALHENLVPSAIKAGMRVGMTDIRVNHVKYAIDAQRLRKKRERNVVVLNKALAKEPDNLEYRVLIGTAYDELGEPDKAFAMLEAILLNLPDKYVPDLHLRQAYTIVVNRYARDFRLKDLDAMLRQMISDYPDSLSVLTNCALMYLNGLGRADVSLTLLKSAEKMNIQDEDEEALGTQDIPGLLQRARLRAAIYAGQFEQARSFLTADNKQRKSLSPNQRQQAKAAFQKGEFARVLEILNPVPLDVEYLNLAANTHKELKNWMAAGELYIKAAALGGFKAIDWLSLATCEMRMNCSPACRIASEFGLQLNPRSLELMHLAAKAAWIVKDAEGLFHWMVQAYLIDPGNPDISADLEKACGEMGISLSDALRKQAMIWTKGQHYPLAARAWTHVAGQNPQDAQAVQLAAMLKPLM
ncbi:MAG: glycosyltransferase [Anaerolineae bacterium]|nr:glycosyltransferase [Anaerolineae bacterium]